MILRTTELALQDVNPVPVQGCLGLWIYNFKRSTDTNYSPKIKMFGNFNAQMLPWKALLLLIYTSDFINNKNNNINNNNISNTLSGDRNIAGAC